MEIFLLYVLFKSLYFLLIDRFIFQCCDYIYYNIYVNYKIYIYIKHLKKIYNIIHIGQLHLIYYALEQWFPTFRIMGHDQAQLFWAKAQNKIKKPKIRILKSPK